MRGGWDGLNVTVPYGDSAYYSLRPNIAIPEPRKGGPEAALDLDGFFGFHPSMTAFHDLYQKGMVAVMPAVQYAAASRSHFAGQDVIESGMLAQGDNGWLARYIQAAGKNPAISAVSISEQMPRSLFGLSIPPLVIPGLSGLSLAASQSDLPVVEKLINTAYSRSTRSGNPYASSLYEIGRELTARLAELQNAGSTYVSADAGYPVSTLGRSLSQASALIKARLGVEVIALNANGWDTHAAQGGSHPQARMSGLLADVSDSIGAFFYDLGVDASRVLLLTATEFGRTAAENGSEGTDHGNASTWMAVGPNVRGGVYLGSGWPGLDPSSLYEGRYLSHTIDFRTIYAEILQGFVGFSNVSEILPNSPRQILGIV
jgi:uncharacterized protein (DUF1501 family)